MSKFKDFGYTISLHKNGADPETGFGFCDEGGEALAFAIGERGALSIAAEWSKYSPDACPHVSFLEGQICKLCGNEYAVSRLNADGTWSDVSEDRTVLQDSPIAGVLAKIVADVQWSYANLATVVLEKDGQRLNGLITIDRDNVEKSMDAEIQAYLTGYFTQITEDGVKVLKAGPWGDVTEGELREALLKAF